MAKQKRKWQGSKWITRKKRLAIYLRDGMACAYCGSTVEDGVTLSLDHLKPWSKGGDNKATNLVTCCKKCNSSRADRPYTQFADAVASYLDHGLTGKQIVSFIQKTRKRPLKPFLAEAQKIIDRRSTFTNAVQAASADYHSEE